MTTVRLPQPSLRQYKISVCEFWEVIMHASKFILSASALSVVCAVSMSVGQSTRYSASGTTPATLADRRVEAPRVRVVYLIPTDRNFERRYVSALIDAAESTRVWFAIQLAGSSVRLSKPVVDIVFTSHPAEWYASNPVGSEQGLWFWFNTVGDAFGLTGGQFNDPANQWLYYIDADPACGQITGGTSGVALFPANDLRGLVGDSNVPPCSSDPPDMGGVCRWVGGLGHELGHALGLPHPTPCPGGATDNTLMCLGYITYPFTDLLASDKAALGGSPFISPTRMPKQTKNVLCGPF